ncbi:MAG: hypothetical protein ACP5KJ_00070 [Candidatus Micrarchaeia archaeon]
MDREEILRKTKEQLRSSYSAEDFLQHSSQTLDDLDEVINVLFEHLRNWYSIYLPEVSKVEDREVYLEIAEKYVRGDEKSLSMLSSKARSVLPKKESVGSPATEKDVEILRSFARRIHELMKLRDEICKYRDETANKIARNLSYLLEPALATKLIVEAHGLKRLANLPASSIQVLGAEKALFMHLTKNTKPPKHGIIFLHPLMRGATKQKRGKIARLLAAKISIAAKADAYSKNFIAPNLKAELERKVEEVLKK